MLHGMGISARSHEQGALSRPTALLVAGAMFMELLDGTALTTAAPRVASAFGVASATLYAAGLAFAAESLARTGVALLNVEEDRYRLLARNMSDVISRHRRNGAVQFISPAVETMLVVIGIHALDSGADRALGNARLVCPDIEG